MRNWCFILQTARILSFMLWTAYDTDGGLTWPINIIQVARKRLLIRQAGLLLTLPAQLQ
nr:hypothetical protein [Nitrosomonas aestuarii]